MARLTKPLNYNELNFRQRRELRLEYTENQDGLCSCCGQPLDGPPSKEVNTKSLNMRLFPAGFLNRPVHLHHDHKTGMTIGAVHAKCNGYLWQYKGE